MTDQTTRDILAELAALRAEVRRQRHRTSIARRIAPVALVALLLALTPLALFAANPFVDLTGGPHDADIDLIYNAGITTGCAPDRYCPARTVTREEMASFLARTAGLGKHPPVANARTVGGYAPDGLVRVFGASNTDNTTGDGVPIGESADVITVPFTAPAAGYVLVTASQTFFTPGNGCPCAVAYNLQMKNADGAEGAISPTMGHRLANGDNQSGTVTWVFQVYEAGAHTFTLYAYRTGGTATIESRAALSGIYVPFGATKPLN